MQRHTEAYTHSCSLCGISYQQFNDLRNHLKANHNKMVKFECSECDKSKKTKVRAAIYTSTSYENFKTHKRSHKSVFGVKNLSVLEYSLHDQ